ncbi:MAG: hypothetical protein ACR2KW_00495 [Rubrobacter sp.]
MHAGIPGIGLGGLFFVLSAFLMLATEIVRTFQGRSSLRRWRVVGLQSAIASGIVLVTVLMLWLLDILFLRPAPGGGPAGLGGYEASTTAGNRFLELVSALPIAAAPILGTLALLVFVLCLSEAARLFVRRPKAKLPAGDDE